MTRLASSIFLFLTLLVSDFYQLSFAGETTIIIEFSKAICKKNSMVFGNNSVGYDPGTYEKDQVRNFRGYSDYGAGLWDPKWDKPVGTAINLAKEVGITLLRYPGGCGVHNYDWKSTIGKERKEFLFGLDEFMKICEQIGAGAVITISDFTGTEQDAADLVAYLNSPVNGKNKWADERAKNRRKVPYNVKYFEIGNESWHGNHKGIKEMSPEEYASKYLRYFEAMKAIDPKIMIGAVLYTTEWNRRVLNVVKDKIDFGIVHIYPTVSHQSNAGLFFQELLFDPISGEENSIRETLELLRQTSGRDVPVAVTEYNIGLMQEKPVPYRFSLGNALLNAELLRIFLKPENNVLFANHWNFINEYWGLIFNGFFESTGDLYHTYYKRPAFFTFELYHRHFGDILLDIDVKNDLHNVNHNRSFESRLRNLLNGEKRKNEALSTWLAVNASKSTDGKKVYLMVINKNMDQSMTSTIELKDFVPAPEGNAWVLNGPSVDATNEKKHDNVKVMHKKFEIKGNPFEYTFEPHSLTAIEIERKNVN